MGGCRMKDPFWVAFLNFNLSHIYVYNFKLRLGKFKIFVFHSKDLNFKEKWNYATLSLYYFNVRKYRFPKRLLCVYFILTLNNFNVTHVKIKEVYIYVQCT